MTASETRGATASTRRRSPFIAVAILAAFAGTAAAGLIGFVFGARLLQARQALPVLRPAPQYTLTNQLGQKVSSASFRGKIQVVTFLFPYCTTMCPLIAAHLANFENLVLRPARLADKVQLVAFDIDPAGTGPQQMREFLKEYGWDPKDLHWQYLTGSASEIRRVVRQGFGVPYERVSLASEKGESGAPVVEPEIVNKLAEKAHVDYDMTHEDVIEIVDRKGRIRKIFDNADTLGARRLLRPIDNILNEPDS